MEQLKGKILSGKILIKPIPRETKTSSGIIIPDSAKEKPLEGVVCLTGAQRNNEPMEVAIGDHVFYGQYSGTEINVDGEKYLLMQQTDILFISNQ